MPNFLIRDLPKDTYRRLKNAAEANRRSLNQEVVSRLEGSLGETRLSTEEFLRRMQEHRAHQKEPVPIEEIVAMIRRDRDDPNR